MEEIQQSESLGYAQDFDWIGSSREYCFSQSQ